jgi:signal transduction histidine kinase
MPVAKITGQSQRDERVDGPRRISKFRLRARFLIVRLLIAAVLTAAVIPIVRYSYTKQANNQISAEIASCSDRFLAFQAQNDSMLRRTAAMLVESPQIRSVLAGHSEGVEERASVAFAWDAGADIFALADGQGNVVASDLSGGKMEQIASEKLPLQASHGSDNASGYWQLGKLLYRVQRRSVAPFGTTGGGQGTLVVGAEMGQRLALHVGAVCGCDVAFAYDGSIVASTVDNQQETELSKRIFAIRSQPANSQAELALAGTPYRALIAQLGANASAPSVELVVLKSLATTKFQQSEFTRLLIILAVGAMALGFFLVLRVSDTFTRPLGNLVEAVRALEKGDFSYPVKVDSHDELEEVTQAFDQMRSSLRDTQHQLIENERLATIGRMASSISHDLRHPLTAIVANSEFLSEEKSTPQQREGFYEEIRAAVDQMNDLVESLLEFSRGRKSPRIVQVNLDEVVERVVRSVASRQEFQKVELLCDCPKPFEASVDPLKMARALGNLLINACEAVSPNSGHVEVRVSGSAETAEIRVRDSGSGVPDAIRETLFQPFMSHGKPNGTGLGLAVVQKICRDHGGEAILESSRPGETVFKMTLPRNPVCNS